jgi:hypothetical protein
MRRVSWHQLPSAWDRPHDIPYVIASLLKSNVDSPNVELSIEESALIATIEWMLQQKQSFGNLKIILSEMTAKYKNTNKIFLRLDDLSEMVRGKVKLLYLSPVFSYDFKLN